MIAPIIYRLEIERFRGIKKLSWLPSAGVNIILGGGDVGKTTILDAIGLLLSPTNATAIADSDYHARNLTGGDGFIIEAVLALPQSGGINYQAKPSWPWEWNGNSSVVPAEDAESGAASKAVYRLRVRGTPDLELVYEILQPDGNPDTLSVALRRAIGLVRLSGDDRNDRDLRLVQGSALERLLSDKALRSRLGDKLADSNVSDELMPEAKAALQKLDEAFVKESLPNKLDIAITGAQGLTITALIGLTAERETNVQLPLASWGAGTRRLAALAIAAQNQGEAPITLVDEVERGLEPYRQGVLIEKLQARQSQTFLTTHSPSVIAAASVSALWYVDAGGNIGRLEHKKIAKVKRSDPETFLARFSVITEGATECGFARRLIELAVGGQLEQYGIHICDAGGHEFALEVLEALAVGGLCFGGFADDEGKHPDRWKRVAEKLDKLLFRWTSGCIEENIIAVIPDDKLEWLIKDPDAENDKTGERLRTLADRLGIAEKDFATIKAKAASNLKPLILDAALGTVPQDKATAEKSERKVYEKHAQRWFKSQAGGRELADKIFGLGMWPALQAQLLPFCNAVRKAVELPEIADLTP